MGTVTRDIPHCMYLKHRVIMYYRSPKQQVSIIFKIIYSVTYYDTPSPLLVADPVQVRQHHQGDRRGQTNSAMCIS